MHVFRFRVVQTFLLAGVPLARLSTFRPLIEQSGFALCDESHLAATYIPRIEEREFSQLRVELSDQFIGISFDGTSRLGEAVNVTAVDNLGSFTRRT